MAKHLVLLGMMGCGKSTLGAYLGPVLNRDFYDVDRMIEEREGRSITEIFQAAGEGPFRALEAAAIRQLLDRPPAIISLGGGAFVQDGVREELLRRTATVYLRARPESLVLRVGNPATRPLLANTDVLATLTTLLGKRESVYQLAHHSIITDGLTVEDVGEVIWEMRQEFDAPEPDPRIAGSLH